MDNKYYIPNEEEFHLGFECEYYNSYSDRWISIILDSSNFTLNDLDGSFDEDYVLSEEYTKSNKFRVKYLDKEDIESLGFKRYSTTKDDIIYQRIENEYTSIFILQNRVA